MKIGLGTVQFGLDYGISNAAGRVPIERVREILDRAAAAGLRVLDTATVYGTAETVLGATLPAAHGFRIVTKLPRLPQDLPAPQVGAWVQGQIAASLDRLQTEAVDAVLMHSGHDLLLPQGDALFAALEALKVQGLAGR